MVDMETNWDTGNAGVILFLFLSANPINRPKINKIVFYAVLFYD